MAKIKTFEAACEALGVNPKALPDFSNVPPKHQAALIAHFKLVIIAQALNDGWEPDWNNNNEWKYFPWFDMEKSSSNKTGFRLDFAINYYSHSYAGSRLCFKSSELAEYAGKTFIKLYKEYFVI